MGMVLMMAIQLTLIMVAAMVLGMETEMEMVFQYLCTLDVIHREESLIE